MPKLARVRFGNRIAEEWAGVLESLPTSRPLASLVQWILDAETGADLLVRVRGLL